MTTRRGPKPETIARAKVLRVSIPVLVRARQQISAALCNLQAFTVYWSGRHRCIVCRSVSCNRHFMVPEGALLIGTNESGTITARDILDDVADAIQRTRSPAPILAAPADLCELETADQAGRGATI